MANGIVVLYFSRFGKPLQTHHKAVLDSDAKAIAKIKGYEFGGHYDTAHDFDRGAGDYEHSPRVSWLGR